MDVRAPVEFAAGSAPGAVNRPLLNNDERAAVGIEYKQQGQDRAIQLGHELISGEKRRQRIESWLEFARLNPQGRLYCFRGGLRSQLVRSVLLENGIDMPLIAGGYKRLRGFFIETIDRAAAEDKFLVLTGLTGAGKTLFLREHGDEFRRCDLEALAQHRGSAFGRLPTEQPPVADFENRLAVHLLRLRQKPNAKTRGPIVLEDESRIIGRITLPLSFFTQMSQAPLVVLDRPRGERVQILVRTYLVENYGLQDGARDEEKILRLSQDIELNLQALAKRLGGAELQRLLEMVRSAIREQLASGQIHAHDTWVERLLACYYDPVYERHLEREKARIAFRGGPDEVRGWLSSQT